MVGGGRSERHGERREARGLGRARTWAPEWSDTGARVVLAALQEGAGGGTLKAHTLAVLGSDGKPPDVHQK